jgi:hypothetical protein
MMEECNWTHNVEFKLWYVLGSPWNELLEYIWVGNVHSMNVQVFGKIHFDMY